MVRRGVAGWTVALLFAGAITVSAQQPGPADSAAPTLPETIVEAETDDGELPSAQANAGQPYEYSPAITSLGRGEDLIGQTPSASQGQFSQEQLEFRPLNRAGDVLELIPGMIATQHSGTGKANQYFVRGINLDHGTDFALRVNGVPMNLPSHGHGQGYLDVNWLIPELIDRVDYRMGPYYADVGDFSSAGAADVYLRNSMPYGIAAVTAGAFDYYRVLVADSTQFAGGQLLYAYESVFYDGPWDQPEDFNKFNGLLRWSVGDDLEGIAITTQAYRGYWNATNQISQRAVDAGLIGRFGTLDPTDAGETHRVGLNAEYWQEHDYGTIRANAYVSYYDLDLFSNFTYFLEDPINGDQIEQIDNRVYSGLNISHQFRGEWSDHTLGFQFRNDNIYELGLNRTRQRELVSPVRNDDVDQQSFSLYYINETPLTDWARSYIGLRGDAYRFHTTAADAPLNSGTRSAEVFSPKTGLVFGPWADSELFLNWGQSFHSNDARGVNSSMEPANPLVKSDGSEIGVRSWLTPGWNSSLAFWYLEIDSELVFVGDAGTTEPGPASHRTGITWTNYWQATDWLALDADYAFVRPRFDGGERIPNAVQNVLSTGFTVRQPESPWYGTIRVRHYGPAALTEDNSARSSTTTVANLQAGYDTEWLNLSVDIFNLFDSDDYDITYFYESQPAGLPAAEDYHFHPVEPLMARASATLKY